MGAACGGARVGVIWGREPCSSLPCTAVDGAPSRRACGSDRAMQAHAWSAALCTARVRSPRVWALVQRVRAHSGVFCRAARWIGCLCAAGAGDEELPYAIMGCSAIVCVCERRETACTSAHVVACLERPRGAGHCEPPLLPCIRVGFIRSIVSCDLAVPRPTMLRKSAR
eukprot:2938250-Prymnesium_polylepis.1